MKSRAEWLVSQTIAKDKGSPSHIPNRLTEVVCEDDKVKVFQLHQGDTGPIWRRS